MSIKSQGHSLILVKGHSDFKVKCLTLGLYTQMSNSGPRGPLVCYQMRVLKSVNLVSFNDLTMFAIPEIEPY